MVLFLGNLSAAQEQKPESALDFTLTDFNGKSRSLSDFRGKVIVLFFGYTSCPDICPTTIIEMKNVLNQLGKEAEKVRMLFITVDPQRDTQKIMKEFLGFHDSRILGLREDLDKIRKVTDLFKVRFKKRDDGSASGYLVGHTSSTFLIDKQGVLKNKLRFKTSIDEIVDEIKKLF